MKGPDQQATRLRGDQEKKSFYIVKSPKVRIPGGGGECFPCGNLRIDFTNGLTRLLGRFICLSLKTDPRGFLWGSSQLQKSSMS